MDAHGQGTEGCFIPVAGLKHVYEPRKKQGEGARKYPCPDCHFCQFCSEVRCRSCRDSSVQGKTGLPRKLSLSEQIRLYEEMNPGVDG